MKALACILAFTLVACAPKKESSGTPIADSYIANFNKFVDDNCSGSFTQSCNRLYWAKFIEALALNYGSSNPADTVGEKYCVPYGIIDCSDERDIEHMFQSNSFVR